MKAEPKTEKETIIDRCACGAEPALVIHKGMKMYAGPNALTCAVRSGWHKKKEEAIRSWNAQATAKRQSRRI